SQTVSLRSSSHRRTAPFRERRQKLLRTDDQKPGTRPLERHLVDRDALHAATVRRTPHRQRFYAATIMAAHTTQKPHRARSQLHDLRTSPHLGIPRTTPSLRRQPRLL